MVGLEAGCSGLVGPGLKVEVSWVKVILVGLEAGSCDGSGYWYWVGIGWIEWVLVGLEVRVGSDGWAGKNRLEVGIQVILMVSLLGILFSQMAIVGNVKILSSWQ